MLKLVFISDTHGQHDKIILPDGDVLVHCGDWTNRGDSLEMERFLDWFSAQPQEHKLFIAGNHELTLDYGVRSRLSALELIKEYTDKDSKLHYLEESSVVIDGIKFYGSPITKFFCNWAFNRHPGKDIQHHLNKIDRDVNVLITHGQPYGILDLVQDNSSNAGRDLHQGCKDLSNRIKDLKDLKVYAGGHLHHGYGQTLINGVQYVNAASCNEAYQPYNAPIVINI
jgi:predicted phosphodiesterase